MFQQEIVSVSPYAQILSTPLEKFEFDRVYNICFPYGGIKAFRRRDHQSGVDIIELLVYEGRTREDYSYVCLEVLDANTSNVLAVLGVGDPVHTHKYSSIKLWYEYIQSNLSVMLVFWASE